MEMISRLHQQDLLLARIQREVGEDVGIKGLGAVTVEDNVYFGAYQAHYSGFSQRHSTLDKGLPARVS